MDLFDIAQQLLMKLNQKGEASSFLSAYDMRIRFNVTDGEPFYAEIKGGRVLAVRRGNVENYSNKNDIELFGDEEGFRLVFERRMSPATAMYYGKVTPRGERAKHCQAALTYTLLRMAQEPDWIARM